MHATKTRKPGGGKNDLKNKSFETCNQTIHVPKIEKPQKKGKFSLWKTWLLNLGFGSHFG
jgi:hypothetical protein